MRLTLTIAVGVAAGFAAPPIARGSTPPENHVQEGGEEDAAAGGVQPASAFMLVGGILPRGALDPGPIIAVEGTYQPQPAVPLRIHAGIDWAYLNHQNSALVGPSDYPRGRLDLIQSSHIWSFLAGGTYDALARRPATLYAGLSLGLSLNRSRFEAASTRIRENDVSLVFEPRAGLRGPLGPVAWRFEIAWREGRHDLGDSGEVGEDAMSGFVARTGLGIGF